MRAHDVRERSLMRYWKNRDGGHPPSIDPAFAEALAGRSDRKFNRKANYKALQLCRQVQRALTLALAGEIGDDVLRDVYIVDVTPAGGSSQLLVHFSVPAQVSIAEVLERLH